MLSCKDATRLCSDALERDLSLRERLSLRMHLAMCAGCTRFEEQLSVLRTLSRRFAGGHAPPAEEPPHATGAKDER
ncbi:MAG: zf-HC2 domain-containing protein [Thauera sp.]